MGRKKNKENQDPDSNPEKNKRSRWNTDCDAILIAQFIAEKAAGNQTDNAGWHQAAFTACAKALAGSEKKSGGAVKTADACMTRWGTLKAQYQLIKALRNKSGWGWDDENKHVVVEDSVWDASLLINGKIRPWRFKGFPLFDEMADLVDGAVAMGEGAFQPGRAPSPDWPEELPSDDFPLDPSLHGAGGRVDVPSDEIQDLDASRGGEDSDMEVEETIPISRKRIRAMSDTPPSSSAAKHPRSDARGHGRKPSNGHALMAVSESLQGIAAALKADSTGPSSPQRKGAAIGLIVQMDEFTKEEKSQIFRLIRSDTGFADTFLAIPEDKPEFRIDYLRAELE
ncbi:hypothetical protein DFH07DRAFT_957399 [Mycena maculata]|uniref:Myb/SANT-like domain-containing protein n=1 Tax=Mycena maculata TaxID=230809 RepID=A0AAD7JCL4_9AGAR|nr:hypothetical protein DFH07DRAFT_957399 [Mycena maculata]